MGTDRFLIVRLGALGDVVHAIPVAAALRRAFPSARIDWLVSAKHREILDLVPVIDRRLVLEDFFSDVRELRKTRYDVAIDLQGLLKSALVARGSGAPRVIGFAAPYARERLASLFYTESYDPGRGGLYHPRETRHVVEINLGMLEQLGVPLAPPEFPIEPVDSVAVRRAREEAGGRFALLNPGAAWPNKRWPPERFAAVAAHLLERYGLKSVALWGPGEEQLAQQVVAGANGAAVLSPTTTIADVAGLTREAVLMVSGDTGPTHIAAAQGTPLVGIYGPTRPVRNGPLSARDLTVSRDTICQCHHLRRCRLDRMCLLDIDAAEVIAAVDRRLAEAPARG
ncbi:MAG TPA: glycosyltransferase family 9 protein [Vicinamibacterales bacterium]